MKTKSLVPLLFLGAGLGLALFSGCATSGAKITSTPDPAVAYANYHSFMMLNPGGLGVVRDPAVTPGLVRQVREQATRALIAKGLTKSTDGYADMLVLIHGSMQDKLDVKDWGLSYGRFGHGLGATQELNSYKQGALFVDVFDGKTRELVWRGSAVAEVDQMPTAQQIQGVVDSILARYPN